jgi:hypothetical protein
MLEAQRSRVAARVRFAIAVLTLLGCVRPADTGTLFGLQFQGEDLSLYALPTVDPTLGKSLVQVKCSDILLSSNAI